MKFMSPKNGCETIADQKFVKTYRLETFRAEYINIFEMPSAKTWTSAYKTKKKRKNEHEQCAMCQS